MNSFKKTGNFYILCLSTTSSISKFICFKRMWNWGFAPSPTSFFGLIQKRKQKNSRQNYASFLSVKYQEF